MSTVHVPILVGPIIEGLGEVFSATQEPHWLVDFTLGGGGHTAAFLEMLQGTHHRVLSLDRDPNAVARGRERFAREINQGRLEIQQSKMSAASPLLQGRPILGCLADLGFSSDQMDHAGRGFSFQADGPLDMRMDPHEGVSAHEYLKQVTEAELVRILTEYGEERFGRRIAASLIQLRRQGKLPKTTHELSLAIVKSIPAFARHGRIHAATRTFQALRIAVNDELEELDWLLSDGILFIKPGGRAAILSFHSLEDRRVKQVFKASKSERSLWHQITKKPIEADDVEVRNNPRARSAKLRIAERQPTKD